MQPGRRDRRGRQGEGRAVPHRRGAGRRQDPVRRRTRRSADLVSLSAHKMYGPKGVGALYVRRKPRVRITAIIDGGGHERGMRSGTLNVPGIVGFGKAAELVPAGDGRRRRSARSRCASGCARGIMDRVTDTYVNGSLEHRLPGNLNICFAYVEGEALLMALKDVAVSSGSACTSASLEPSLRAARARRRRRAGPHLDPLRHRSLQHRGRGRLRDRPRRQARSSKLRELSPLYEMAKEGIDLKSVQWAAH